MFAADGSISAGNGGVDIVRRWIDPFECWRATTGTDYVMLTACVGDVAEQNKPSLTTLQDGSKLPTAKREIG